MKRLGQFNKWLALGLMCCLAMIAAGVMTSCSPKKNTAATRNYQAFLTRYNIYYNGDEHFKETLKEMEKKYEDDYSQTLFMHPADARNHERAPQPEGSFDRSIEKAQKAIQLHSIKKRPRKKPGKTDAAYKAWLKRDEYNPFLHNAWMMMGRSQYYNGDFAGAASTFYYVTKHFSWLPNTVMEAKLWQARAYCSMDWLFEAENIITRIKPDELTNKTLKGLYHFTYADFLIRSHDYDRAIPQLRDAISYAKGAQKTRLTFLLGQLYAASGHPSEAYEAFKKAGGASSASYRTKFNARIKQSEVYQGANIEPEVKALQRMARYDRNKEYLDQIYYAIGNLYLSRRDTLAAIENYKLAAEKSTRNGIDKAIGQITLGNLYFERGNYDLAQPCYSEAVPQLSEEYPDYALLKRRSDVLDELAVYSQNVTLQDSLLRLASMTPEEQHKVADKLIEELKKKEKEEAERARREEYLAEQQAMGSNLNTSGTSQAPNSFQLNTDNSWYFYNTATRNAGKTEFQRRWGSRKLENDWRRRNKASFDFNDFNRDSDADDDEDAESDENADPSLAENPEEQKSKEELERENDPHFPEYYLKQIPSTPEEIMTSNDVIQEGLYNMGIILKNKLADYGAASHELTELLSRYPDNIYRLDAYYNLYLMCQQAGKAAEAEHWRQLILTEFPESAYGIAMRDPAYLENLRLMEQRQEGLYAQAYADYLANRNAQVHSAYSTMMRDFPLSKLMPKFMFLHALAYVTENKPDEFNATLKEMLERYPTTDMTDMASAYLKGMAQGRKLHAGVGGNMRGMLWDTRLGNDSTAMAAADGPVEFTLDPAAPQMFLLLYPAGTVNPNALLYDVARHNFTSYVVRDFDLETMQFGPLGIIAVKGFDNADEVNAYRSKLESDRAFTLPPGVRPVVISVANFDLMLQRGASFEEYFQFIGEESIRDTHEAVLPPEEYPSAQEMYAEPPVDTPEELLEEPVEEPQEQPLDPPAENPDSSESVESDEPVTPEPQPHPEPAKRPEPQPQPKPEPQPVVIPDGSEGDDPLLD